MNTAHFIALALLVAVSVTALMLLGFGLWEFAIKEFAAKSSDAKPGTDAYREEFERQVQQFLSNMTEDEMARTTRAIGQATRVIMAKLATLERTMDVKLDDLLDAVASQQTKIDSLIELANGLHSRVLEAMGDTITPSQKMRIAQVFDAVKENSDEVDAAIVANTVAATAGAVSDGASAADIKDQVNNVTPAPTPMPEPGASGVDLPGGAQ